VPKKATNPEFVPSIVPEDHVPQQLGVGWFDLFGLKLGEEALIFPNGAAGVGQALQGTLIDIAFSPENGPIAVIIAQPDKPRCVVPWASIMMMTKATAPTVDVPQPEVTMADLVRFADEQGLEVPDDVRAEVALGDEDEYGSMVDPL
jgi:hypothetical protein